MENQHDTLSNHELRQLWTRFEGLVGHQLHRLQVDGSDKRPPMSPKKCNPLLSSNKRRNIPSPNVRSASLSPTKVVSSEAVIRDGCSSLRSEMVSNVSSRTNSLKRLPQGKPQNYNSRISVEGSCVDGCHNITEHLSSVGSGVYRKCNDGGGGGEVEASRRGEDFSRSPDTGGVIGGLLGSPVDECLRANLTHVDERDSSVDRHDRNAVVEKEPEVEGGDGGSVSVDLSSSCCLLPSRGSSETSVPRGLKCNSCTNAASSCQSQPLCGLPYVARATGPLLSLLNVTMDDWDSKKTPIANTLLKLKDKKKENKRNMLGVYKQSLLLESQLHQYLNPGLMLSLNRRVARATFDAEMMAKLIDRLKKEAKRSVDDPRRASKVIEVSSKIKSLLGRQKCEWQCVGRLKETLTMAEEMKNLLQFIARLSTTLEKSKATFGSFHDRPPPYDYCNAYSSIAKTVSQESDLRRKNEISDIQQNVVDDPKLKKTVGSPVAGKQCSLGRYSSSRGPTSQSELSVSERSSAGEGSRVVTTGSRAPGSGQRFKRYRRNMSLSPRKFRRSPVPKRSKSTNIEPDSYSSYVGGSNVLSRDDRSDNSNASANIAVVNMPTITLKDGECIGRTWNSPMIDGRILDSKNKLSCISQDNSSDDPPLNKRAPELAEQNNSGRAEQKSSVAESCAFKSASPPRARPKKDCPKPQNTRWDNSSHRSRENLTLKEGPPSRDPTPSSKECIEESCSESGSPDSCCDKCCLPCCCSVESNCGCCSGDGDASKCGSICISIESEHKGQMASRSPGCRRIRVKVNKCGKSESPAKEVSEVKEEETLSESDEPESEVLDELTPEKEPTPIHTPKSVTPKPSELSPQQEPTPIPTPKSETPKPEPKSPKPEPKSPKPSEPTPEPEPTPIITPKPVSPKPESWLETITPYSSVNIDDRTAESEPNDWWKYWVAGLLALLLLLFLMSLLRGTCCGCGYFPNPLFFLTDSMARRVTLRHHGAAPT